MCMKINQIKVGAVLSYLSMGLSTVISLVYTPIMIARLGDSEYGVYNLVLPIISYLNLLSFGLGSAYVRYYSRFKVEDNKQGMARINGMFLVTYSVLGALVLAIGLFLTFHGNIIIGQKLTAEEIALGEKLLRIMTVNAALYFPVSVFESHVTINERYLFQKIVYMGKQVLNPLIMIPLLLLGFRSVTMTVTALVFTVLSGAINIYYCLIKLHMPFDFRKYDFKLMREMMGFTFYVFLGIVVENINWSIDRLMMGWVHGTTAVTVYTVASQLNVFYLSFSNAVTNVLTPRVHRMVAEKQSNMALTRLFAKAGRLQFILLACIFLGFVAVGETFVVLWGGDEQFRVDYIVTLLLFASIILPAIQTVGIEIQRAKNMHKFRSVTYLIVAVINAILLWPACYYWQGIGAAACVLLTTVFGQIIPMNWYYYRRIGLNIPWFWKKICQLLPSMVVPAVVAVCIALFARVENYFHIVAWGCVFVAVYAVFLWLFGLNRFERELITGPLDKVLRRLKRG